ncbi:hypothetical protein EQG49_03725 [Periweissella cryptocerci]|uniref:Uncharacterized protein n=1 Tax=Periweissella cryptocerci TaxID=2506420 RepID=A0A4P6YSF1_9LACO|nr:hypothetical protein [Periweissella cryptocerci]QBO35628.1 hypothetical protein EQG49_03725 [Periweissella cryptocerci]
MFGKKQAKEAQEVVGNNDELRDLYLVEVQQIVTEAIEDRFGSSVVVFPAFSWESGTLSADFIAYRSFAARVQVSFKTKQHTEKGMLNIMIGVGPLWEDVQGLLESDLRKELEPEYTKENLVKALELTDHYLQWRLTDTQKIKFGIE